MLHGLKADLIFLTDSGANKKTIDALSEMTGFVVGLSGSVKNSNKFDLTIPLVAGDALLQGLFLEFALLAITSGCRHAALKTFRARGRAMDKLARGLYF